MPLLEANSRAFLDLFQRLQSRKGNEPSSQTAPKRLPHPDFKVDALGYSSPEKKAPPQQPAEPEQLQPIIDDATLPRSVFNRKRARVRDPMLPIFYVLIEA